MSRKQILLNRKTGKISVKSKDGLIEEKDALLRECQDVLKAAASDITYVYKDVSEDENYASHTLSKLNEHLNKGE